MCSEDLEQGFAAMSTNQEERASVIELTGATPFASGDNRLCFRHPDFPDRCIKILRGAGPAVCKRHHHFISARCERRTLMTTGGVSSLSAACHRSGQCAMIVNRAMFWLGRDTLGNGLVTDFVPTQRTNRRKHWRLTSHRMALTNPCGRPWRVLRLSAQSLC